MQLKTLSDHMHLPLKKRCTRHKILQKSLVDSSSSPSTFEAGNSKHKVSVDMEFTYYKGERVIIWSKKERPNNFSIPKENEKLEEVTRRFHQYECPKGMNPKALWDKKITLYKNGKRRLIIKTPQGIGRQVSIKTGTALNEYLEKNYASYPGFNPLELNSEMARKNEINSSTQELIAFFKSLEESADKKCKLELFEYE